MSTTTLAGWSISSSADAFWIRQLEAWQATQDEEFKVESFFSSGSPGIVFESPQELTELEYKVPTLDPAAFNPAGVAAAILILSAVGQDIALQTKMEGAKITNAKNMAHREDTILKLQQKIQKARYKTPWERLTNWMKHSFWGKFIMILIQVALMVASIALAVVTFGGASAAVALAIVACCMMTASMITELATDGKSIGENIAEKVTKDKAQAQKIAMGIDITWMVLEIACSVGSGVAGGSAAGAQAGADAAEKTARMTEKAMKIAQKIEKVTRFVQAAYTLAEATIKLGYAISQSELIKAKASAEAERTRMEAISEWIQDIIDQYMQDIADALGTARDAYERASKVIQEQAEVARLIASNLR
jgi:hypothetical protein